MRTSDSIAKFAKAMALFQATMPDPVKDAVNPHFGKTYVDIGTLLRTVRAPMAKCGLSFIQSTGSSDRSVIVTTLLMHDSGEFVETDPLSIPVAVCDAQKFGSALTYARRYSLQAAIGAGWEEDDDGNSAVPVPTPPGKPATPPQKPTAGTKPVTGKTISAANCPNCGGPISAAEAEYSTKKFGKVLCMKCQKLPVAKMPPENNDDPGPNDYPDPVE